MISTQTLIIHQSSREDRKVSVRDLIDRIGNAQVMEAISPTWESTPANIATRGCSLSHLCALRISSGHEFIMVLEDDAKILPEGYEAWLNVTDLPADCGAVLLGGDVDHHLPGLDGWHEVQPPFWGSHAVLYHRSRLEKTDFLTNAYEIIASNQVGTDGNGFGLCYESILLMALHSVGLKLYCREHHAFSTTENLSARSGSVEPPRMRSIRG